MVGIKPRISLNSVDTTSSRSVSAPTWSASTNRIGGPTKRYRLAGLRKVRKKRTALNQAVILEAGKNSTVCYKYQNCIKFARSDAVPISKLRWSRDCILMTPGRKLIHCLLILSIGLLPASIIAADEVQHTDDMSTGSFDCDTAKKAVDPSCDNESCLLVAHCCGANSGAVFIALNLSGELNQFSRFIKHPLDKVGFRSRRAESIYRPPIAWIKSAHAVCVFSYLVRKLMKRKKLSALRDSIPQKLRYLFCACAQRCLRRDPAGIVRI